MLFWTDTFSKQNSYEKTGDKVIKIVLKKVQWKEVAVKRNSTFPHFTLEFPQLQWNFFSSVAMYCEDCLVVVVVVEIAGEKNLHKGGDSHLSDL